MPDFKALMDNVLKEINTLGTEYHDYFLVKGMENRRFLEKKHAEEKQFEITNFVRFLFRVKEIKLNRENALIADKEAQEKIIAEENARLAHVELEKERFTAFANQAQAQIDEQHKQAEMIANTNHKYEPGLAGMVQAQQQQLAAAVIINTAKHSAVVLQKKQQMVAAVLKQPLMLGKKPLNNVITAIQNLKTVTPLALAEVLGTAHPAMMLHLGSTPNVSTFDPNQVGGVKVLPTYAPGQEQVVKQLAKDMAAKADMVDNINLFGKIIEGHVKKDEDGKVDTINYGKQILQLMRDNKSHPLFGGKKLSKDESLEQPIKVKKHDQPMTRLAEVFFDANQIVLQQEVANKMKEELVAQQKAEADQRPTTNNTPFITTPRKG